MVLPGVKNLIADLQDRPSYGLIYRYIAKEIFISFVVAYLVCFAVLFVNIILVLAANLENKNVALPDILLLVIFWVPRILYLTFPYSIVIGSLMASGRLSSDNEYISFLSCGISVRRMAIPFVVFGILIGVSTFLIGDKMIPEGMVRFNNLYLSLIRKNPRMELEPNSVRRFNDMIIVTGNIEKNTIYNIIIYDKTKDKNLKRIIYADKAVVAENAQQKGVISFVLTNVTAQTPDPQILDKYEYLFADRMEYNIILNDPQSSVRSASPEEMSLKELYTQIRLKEAELEQRYVTSIAKRNRLLLGLRSDYFGGISEKFSSTEETRNLLSGMLRNIAEYQALSRKPSGDYYLRYQYYKFYDKFAAPVACLILMLAFPLGFFAKRSGRILGLIMGFGFAVFYYSMTILLQTAGIQLRWNALFVVWLPNIVLSIVFLFIFLKRVRT